jgi:ComF family protein
LSFVPPLEHVESVASPTGTGATARVWLAALLDLILPSFCPVCHRRLDDGRRDPLCRGCWEALERVRPPFCRMCGLPLLQFASPEAAGARANTPLCGHCRRRSPPFAYARSAARYGEVARAALHAFKFSGRRALAAPLGDLLAELRPPLGAPDLLVPVPLHPRRERERGFNQAQLLARRVGQAWQKPVRSDVLARTVATRPQSELTAAARRANVRDAFVLHRPELVAGRHVVLVDDIFTTGSTVSACARRLKGGGASVVGVLTVARAV